MALSYIGKPIALISHSDVRYRGILAGIDHHNSTIQLSNVYSMGTETRRPPEEYIPPVPEPYAYIIFRASEVKDLGFDEPVQRPNVHADPAVLGASTTIPPQGFGYGAQPRAAVPQAVPTQPQPGPSYGAAAVQQPVPTAPPAAASDNRRGAGVHTATASMETVERAIGDLRGGSAEAGRGGRRGGGRGGDGKNTGPAVPTTDFDFQSNNARFDKASLKPQRDDSPAADGPEDEEAAAAYNPQKSFFDSLTPARGGPGGGERGRGRGRGGRSRRDEERDKNVATFGEPGGVGLMGPGAYVGGYGNRRGRGRRAGGGRA